MQITETPHSNYVSLAPAGDLDANSSIAMDEAIQAQMDAGNFNLHIDCSELIYISSAGLGVFISFMEELGAKGGKFVFSDMSDKIYKVFELLGLHQLMKIVPLKGDVEKEFTA